MKHWLEQQGATFLSGKRSHLKVSIAIICALIAALIIFTACKEVSSTYYSVKIADEFYGDYKIRREKYSEYIHEGILFLVSARNCTHEDVCIFASVYSEKFIPDVGEIEKVEVFSNSQTLMTFYAKEDLRMRLGDKGVYYDSYKWLIPIKTLEEYRLDKKSLFVRVFFKKDSVSKIFSYPLEGKVVTRLIFPT
jgi:hypothetical protein